MELTPETIRLFKHLQRCYDIREILFPSKTTERVVNNANIHYYEAVLDLHCMEYYKIPWFRVYTYWKVYVQAPNPDLDY